MESDGSGMSSYEDEMEMDLDQLKPGTCVCDLIITILWICYTRVQESGTKSTHN